MFARIRAEASSRLRAIRFLSLCLLWAGLLLDAAPASAEVSSSPATVIFSPVVVGAAPRTASFAITVATGTVLDPTVSVLTLGAPDLDFTLVAAGTTCPVVTSGACSVKVQLRPAESDLDRGGAHLDAAPHGWL